jgi:nucleoside-diphosphate-sugar epimerase
MRVFVTGGYGFLGSHVTRALEARGVDVRRATHYEYDLTNLYEVEEMILDARPNVIVHCAAFVGGIDLNVAEPGRMMFDNLRMGMNVVEQARRHGVKRVVLIGTACSYPATENRVKWDDAPLQEDELLWGPPAAETRAYGVAKLTLLELARAYRAQYGTRFDYLIPTNLYGPGDNFDLKTGHVIPSMIVKFGQKRNTKSAVTLYGDGTQTRDFLYVEDAAHAIGKAAEQGTNGEPINLGSGSETSIREVAEILSELSGGVRFDFDGSKPVGTQRRLLDTARAKEELGWMANTELRDGLEQTVNWYRGRR